MGEYNVAPNTQIGKIIIDEKVYDKENSAGEEYYQRSGEFIENLTCDNIIEYCHRWFHLAGFEEFLNDIDEYYNNKSIVHHFSNLENSPIIPVSSKVTCPITFQKKSNSPIIFHKKRPENLNYKDLLINNMEK